MSKMKSGNLLTNRFWTGIPPWVLIGAVLVLLPIFSFMTIENINRQKENSERLLKEKAAALIRSFEAGTRTGMAGRWEGFQLQKLLMETAQQPDIVHLIVTDAERHDHGQQRSGADRQTRMEKTWTWKPLQSHRKASGESFPNITAKRHSNSIEDLPRPARRWASIGVA